jgi:hypothetical protein
MISKIAAGIFDSFVTTSLTFDSFCTEKNKIIMFTAGENNVLNINIVPFNNPIGH